MAREKKHLIILHIDGLSYKRLLQAIKNGHMPTMKRLVEKDGYQVVGYRTGIPSTTPFAQAGILYGNNHNIPSFTWFDKQSGVLVKFGTLPTFQKVSHKYFKKDQALTRNGASIAACYPAEAAETFALAFDESKSKTVTRKYARMNVWLRWFINPLHILDWLRYTLIVLLTYAWKFIQTRFQGENVAMKYFFANILQEIFLHHMTRYATVQAMKQGFPVIYSAFYAYDDGAHAFGPDDPFCQSMLRQLDRSIHYINKNRLHNKIPYELLILSDHGQIPTMPFRKRQHQNLGQLISSWFPKFDVNEHPGIHVAPKDTVQDGEIVVTYSGGIGHLYIRNLSGRATQDLVEKTLPKLLDKLIKLPEIGSILLKKSKQDVLMTQRKTFILSKGMTPSLKKYLSQFDDPDILLKQLRRLNSFDKAGDIVFFGSFIRGKQINFENQFGGHGAFGGEQMHPFLLVKPEWKLKTNNLDTANKVHYEIKKLLNTK